MKKEQEIALDKEVHYGKIARSAKWVGGDESSIGTECEESIMAKMFRQAGAKAATKARWDNGKIHPPLSERQYEIVYLVADGNGNKQIAEALNISPWTVDAHLRRACEKLDVNTRAALVARVLAEKPPHGPHKN